MKRYPLTALLAAACLTGPALAQDDLPNVSIFATGGTIAGSSSSSTDTTDYESGNIGVDQLLEAVPELSEVARISGEQVANTGSFNVDQRILMDLHAAITEAFAGDTDGAVITHGTDTMEETGFFLDLTVDSDKPIVMVGAMRPATAISADGPINLLQAVTLAGSENGRGRGAMIVLNDRIGSAYFTTKTDTLALNTFKAIEEGYLGRFLSNEPYFYYPPVEPVNKPSFDISEVEELPRVDIVYGYQDVDAQAMNAAIEAGAEGIVIAAVGNGNIPDRMNEAVEEAIANGIPVVRSTRTGNGIVTAGTDPGIGSGVYNPQKARIVLMLALATGQSMEEIEEHFLGAL